MPAKPEAMRILRAAYASGNSRALRHHGRLTEPWSNRTRSSAASCRAAAVALRPLMGKIMFQIMVLVCAINITPADCQTDTAIKTLRGPEAANEVQCGLYGQAHFAQLGQYRLTKGQYLKVMCTRTSIGKTAS
jgi:hypothetical protein